MSTEGKQPITCTPLMYVEVAGMISPCRQAYIRSAGSGGAAAFEELVARGKVVLHVEQLRVTTGDDTLERVPVAIMVSRKCTRIRFPSLVGNSVSQYLHKDAILVINHSSLRGIDTTDFHLEKLNFQPIRHLRYILGPKALIFGHPHGMSFSYGFQKVKSIEMVGFGGVVAIWDNVLSECRALTNLSLCPLLSTIKVGQNFMTACDSLTTIDLSPLKNVTSVGRQFLAMCMSLKDVDLCPMGHLTTVGDFFLFGCSSLTSISFNPQCLFETVGSFFAFSCASLTTIDLRPFGSIGTVDAYFLSSCRSITSVDLSPLRNVVMLGSNFMSCCTALTTINFSSLENLTVVGNSFLEGCTSLTSVDFTPLRKVISVGGDFMNKCPLTAAAADTLKHLEGFNSVKLLLKEVESRSVE